MAPTGVNRQWIYKQRPQDAVGVEHFEMREVALPTAGAGQLLVRVLVASVSPGQRAWMMTDTYRPRLQPGEVMASYGLAEVVESRSEGFTPGDIVDGDFGWQDYAVVAPGAVRRRQAGIPLEWLVGVLNLTGFAAHVGLFEVARPWPGETVVVSGAGGATGCVAVQLVKLAGCRVVAIAGGAAKGQWLVEELGADAAVDYKSGDLDGQLQAACPEGIDVYFDNTGGEILAAVLARMNAHGRVACCGSVSQYNQDDWGEGPRGVPGVLVAKRIRMQGFVVFDHLHRRPNVESGFLELLRSGKLKAPVQTVDRLENAPQALIDLLEGRNRGKMMVSVASPRQPR